MAELKGTEKLNRVFEKFFEGLGYGEIECELSTEFAYWTDDLITYTLIEMPLYDIGFKTYLKETYPKMPECSMMVFSLLHELGHHLTLDNIPKRKQEKCKRIKEKLLNRKCRSAKAVIQKQKDYCNIYDEKIATQKAVQILEKNYDYILKFEKIWFKAVMEFYHKNGITND